MKGKKNYKKEILEDVRDLELKVLELEKKLKSECLGDRSFEGFFMTKQEVIKEAMEYQKTRSKRSRAIDEKSANKRRLSPTAENLLRWMKNPSRFDIIGVDAYRAKRPTADLEIDLEVWWRGQKLPEKPKVRKKKKTKNSELEKEYDNLKKSTGSELVTSEKDKALRRMEQIDKKLGYGLKPIKLKLYKIPYSGASGNGYYVTLASGPSAAKEKFFEDMGVTDKIDGKAMPTTNKFIGNKNMITAVKDGGFARVFPSKKKSSSKPKKSSGRIYTNDELYEIANEILTPKKIKFTLDKSKIDENLELFTITPNTRSVKDGSLDGLEILYYPKERYFEAVEQMAGPKENQLWIYKTTKSPRIAIKQILKGNNRKKDVEKVIR